MSGKLPPGGHTGPVDTVEGVKEVASMKLYLCMVGKFVARWWASILLMGRLRVPALCCSSQGRSWYSHLAMPVEHLTAGPGSIFL